MQKAEFSSMPLRGYTFLGIFWLGPVFAALWSADNTKLWSVSIVITIVACIEMYLVLKAMELNLSYTSHFRRLRKNGWIASEEDQVLSSKLIARYPQLSTLLRNAGRACGIGTAIEISMLLKLGISASDYPLGFKLGVGFHIWTAMFFVYAMWSIEAHCIRVLGRLQQPS